MFLYILFFILLVLYVFSFNIYEFLDENKVPESDVPLAPAQLPITPDFSSNRKVPEYSNEFINNPERTKEERKSTEGTQEPNNFFNAPLKRTERLDNLQNKNYSVQPKDLFFDIFNINCTQPYGRPWACLLYEGNNINNLPLENCERVCPDRFKEENGKKIPDLTVPVKIPTEEYKESFEDFIEEPPYPKHYYCYSYCKKGCIKRNFNPLEPWRNTCGENGFSQAPLDVFLSEDECISKSFPCESLSKDQCLLNQKCGYCTNNSGQGFCFESTTEGPLDPTIPCVPDREKPTNSFFKGHLDPFDGIKQKW